MSTRSVFTLVGAAIGAYFGNAALGATIGSYVGGVVDPTKVKGPRITDAQTQTSQDGVPIPIIYGTVRISGNIIATGKLEEHKHKDNGKGSGTETTTYTYTRTYAIGICEGPIYGIKRIWRDGKLVLDQSRSILGNYEQIVANQQFLEKSDRYFGDEEQTPNSALEAIFGENEVPSFRGLAYLVMRDDDLTDRAGSIPSYEFEVTQYGSSVFTGEYIAKEYAQPRWAYPAGNQREVRANIQSAAYEYAVWAYSESAPGSGWLQTLGQAMQYAANIMGQGSFDGELMGWTYDYTFTGSQGGSGPQFGVAPAQVLAEPQGSNRAVMGRVYSTTETGEEVIELDINALTPERVAAGIFVYKLTNGSLTSCGSVHPSPVPQGYRESTIRIGSNTFYFYPAVTVAVRAIPTCVLLPGEDWVQIPGTPDFYVAPDGDIHRVGSCEERNGVYRQLRAGNTDSAGITITSFPLGPVLEAGDPADTRQFWEDSYEAMVLQGQIESGLVYNTDYPVAVGVACYCSTDEIVDIASPLLSEIVADICYRKGLTTAEIDVAQLTDTVLGFTLASATAAADAINALAPAYLFDGSEYDGKIHFRKRGGPTLLAMNEQDAFDSSDGRIVETRSQELELPRKMVVSYMDVDANYAVTTQTAERLSTSVASSGSDQVEITAVMTADKAAQVADTLLKDQWTAINGTLALSVPDYYSELVPADVIYLSFEEATFRARVTKATNSEGIVELELQQDSASAYSSVATGVPPRPAEEGNSTVVGPTFFEVMNLPALRDKDDQPGIYLAANGPIGRWDGAQIDVSYDAGATWASILQVTQPGTLGVLQTTLDIWGHEIPDTEHLAYVQVSSGDFESVTLDQMFSGSNAICIGDEVLQFRSETMPEDKQYTLGNPLFRGRKNTRPQAWAASTRVVSLDDAYFIPLDRSRIGSSIQFRATTSGTDTQYGVIRTLDFGVAKSVQEWSPTNIRHSRDTSNNLSLAWSPRHRLGTSRNPYASTSFTGFRLVFSNGTTTKSVDTSAQSYFYSAAQQAADFGSAGPLTLTIYATNSIVGPGEGVTVNV